MLKQKMKDNPVLYLHLDNSDKQALKNEAEKRGMPSATLARMVILEFLNKCAKEN